MTTNSIDECMWVIYGEHNDSYAFRSAPRPSPFSGVTQPIVADMSGEAESAKRCGACGELSDKWNEPLSGLRLRRRRYDFSSTYDGIRVVSERFHALYEESGFTGLRFRRLPDDPAFHDIYPTRQLTIDQEQSRPRCGRWCPVCSRHGVVTLGPKVVFTEHAVIAENEFVRTDLEFADGDEKHPLILFDSRVAAVLKAANLKGAYINRLND